MGAIVPFEAYSFAARFNLREVEGWLPEGAKLRSTKTQLVASWADDRVAYAFDFGTLVLINLEPERRDAIVARFAGKLPQEPHPPLRETVLVELREGSGIEVTFDRVVVPALTSATLEVVATVIAQSAALDYYDEDIQGILDRIGRIATQVAKEGQPRGRTRDLVRFIGAAIASQVEIISALALLDKPDLTWENELADRLHDRLRYNLEISERYRAVEAKLLTTREALAVFLELIQTRRNQMLELAVVVLILVEILIGIAQLH
jgi:uncharacterized Rmd1/YagE family protein